MTFDAGKPVRLYEFARGINRWRYCTADRDLVVASVVWTALQIADGGFRQSDDPKADQLTVTVPATIPIVSLYRGAPPGGELRLTVRTLDVVDDSIETNWIGTVFDVRRRGLDRAEIIGGTLDNSMGLTGLRLCWQRDCPHALYDHWCRVERDDFRTDAAVTSMSGLAVSATAFDAEVDGWFTGGYVEWESAPGVVDRRHILAHVGAELQLLGGTFGIAIGTLLRAFAGCDRTWATCVGKFANDLNHGGHPKMSGKSPFDGTPVF